MDEELIEPELLQEVMDAVNGLAFLGTGQLWDESITHIRWVHHSQSIFLIYAHYSFDSLFQLLFFYLFDSLLLFHLIISLFHLSFGFWFQLYDESKFILFFYSIVLNYLF